MLCGHSATLCRHCATMSPLWSQFLSDFVFKDSFGFLNARAKKLSSSFIKFYFFLTKIFIGSSFIWFWFKAFHSQITVWNLKLPSKTAKLPSKVQIAVQKSWSNCNVNYKEYSNVNKSLNIFLLCCQSSHCRAYEKASKGIKNYA